MAESLRTTDQKSTHAQYTTGRKNVSRGFRRYQIVRSLVL